MRHAFVNNVCFFHLALFADVRHTDKADVLIFRHIRRK